MSSSTREATRDSNELYCTRLAEITYALYGRRQHGEAFRSDAESKSLLKVKIADVEYTEQRLYEALLRNPKLQHEMSVRTHYVPSKWLLEQELGARGDWPGEAAKEAAEGARSEARVVEPDVYRIAAEKRLMGVCLSGGGIRSATFNLGVLQGLAQLGLLPCIDYLSSVSGGGYIHQFLAAWILRDPGGRDAVMKKLIPQAEPGCPPRAPEPIRWLLKYASYLTPARGIFSADSWTMVAIWLRNTILNQVPILAGLASAFFLIHMLAPMAINNPAHYWKREVDAVEAVRYSLLWCGVVAGLIGLASIWVLGRNLYLQTRLGKAGPFPRKVQTSKLLTNGQVQTRIVLPWLACAVWMSFWGQMPFRDDVRLHWIPVAIGFGMVLLTVLVMIFAAGTIGAHGKLHGFYGWAGTAGATILFILAGTFATAIACGFGYGFVMGSWWVSESINQVIGTLGNVVHGSGDIGIDPWRIRLVLLPPTMLSVPYIAIELTLGLLGRDFSETRREWLARMRAWSLLYGLLWGALVSVVLLGPYVVYFILDKGLVASYSAIGTVLAAHGITIGAGWSGKADGKPSDKGFLGFKPMDLLALVAAPITILGILIALSFAVSIASDTLTQLLKPQGGWWGAYWFSDLLCLVAAALVAALFGWRVDINEFSMLSFYRNRLTRCYLGATVPDRQPDPFTGFDDRTKVSVESVRAQSIPPLVSDLLPARFNRMGKPCGEYHGPFPIFCTTLNLTTGEDLATQERKGASFVFTPIYSGYSVPWTDGQVGSKVSLNGFVPTEQYAYRHRGIHVDTAVAISGAAVNPNMGYNSNPALAFLMTLFNVRLGWWISNPRMTTRWRATESRPTPVFAAWYLFKELFGMVNDASNYVNLSDGGHFENMGLYELVRRRCSYIIVCDAEADADMKFEGIGSAITRCRADFGAEIDLDLRPLQIDEKTGYSRTHCVVGTVRYPPPPEDMESAARGGNTGGPRAATSCACLGEAGDDHYTGVIVYLKSSLVGDEPADLLAYKLRHEVFPHDMTANQWFAETQFESYRRLGHHVTMSALQPALPPAESSIRSVDEIDALFQRMYAIWYPRTPEMEKHLQDHLRQYEGILTELRTRPELVGLEARLNDGRSWVECAKVEWEAPQVPANSHDYAMQFANSLVDFMYTIYTNLQLAFPDNRVSPHAEWWICLFRRWCRVTLLQEAWLEHVPGYPLEFRLFARRELMLPGRGPYVE